VAGALLLTCAALAGAGDWPRFRGPNGTGVAADKDVPVTWGPEQNVLWKAELPGRGNSSPIISAGRVFLQSSSEDGKERRLYCLDAATGKRLWSQGEPGARAKTHPKNSLASGTPAADGERVFVTSWDGRGLRLLGYDFAGKLLWQRDLGPYTSQHGPGHSPIVHDGRVILLDDQDGSSAVLVFDARDGKPLWQASRKPFRACYSTPFVRATAAGPELIVASTAGVSGYDPRDGSENWHYDWSFTRMPLRTVASPVEAAGLVVATSGDGAGDRHMIAVRLGGKGDVTKTHLAWENRRDFPYVPTLLAAGGHLFSVNDKGTAACYDAATGREVWSKPRLLTGVSASPVLVDGKVYAAGEDGKVCVFQADTTFKLLAKNELGEPVMATPAVADGRLYLRGKDHLFCIGKPAAK
jgi:outer membrane protein assembly factor BamB